MDPFSALLGILGAVVGPAIAASADSPAAPVPVAPKPQYQALSGGKASPGISMTDPGARQSFQDPAVRMAALDRFRQTIGA